MKFPICVAEGSIPSRARGELEKSSEEGGVGNKTPTKIVATRTGLKAAGQRGREVEHGSFGRMPLLTQKAIHPEQEMHH